MNDKYTYLNKLSTSKQNELIRQDIENLKYIFEPDKILLKSLNLPPKELINIVSPQEQMKMIEDDPSLYEFIENPVKDVSIEQ